MRSLTKPTSLSFVVVLLLVGAVCGQIPRPDVGASSELGHAVAAFSVLPITSIHLAGTAHAISGAASEAGTFSFDEARSGDTTLVLRTGQLSRTLTSVNFAADPTCQWTDASEKKHIASMHNCLLSLDWVLPSFSLAGVLSKVGSQLGCTGGNSRLVCVQVWRSISNGTPRARSWIRRLSTVSLTLDSATGLPASLGFDFHPEDDALTNIPVLIRYSDYRKVNGAQLPFRIQKFVNNGLVLDLTVDSAAVQ